MLIYGTRAVHITSEASNEVTCPLCENKTAMTMTVYRKHFHVFWIPMFPLAKAVMECQSCGNEIEENDSPLLIKNKFQKVKEEAKGPIWQFVGLAFFIIIVGLSIYSSGERDKQELIYITTPQEGDIYNYKVDVGSYSSLKVVTEQIVYLLPKTNMRLVKEVKCIE